MILIPKSVDIAFGKDKATILFDIVDSDPGVMIKNIVIISNSLPDNIPKFVFLKKSGDEFDLITKNRIGDKRTDTVDVEIPESPLKTFIIKELLIARENYLQEKK